jgi:hypothetical protein
MLGMTEPYNRFSGQSLDRLTSLSDGVFALAIVQLYFIVSPRLPRVGRAQPPDVPGQ